VEHGPVVPVITQRLILRDFVDADWPAVHAMRADPAVARSMDFHPETPAQSRAWLTSIIASNQEQPRTAYNLAIVKRADSNVIGWIGIGSSSRHPGEGELGFGYMLHRSAWGHGYATEAARAIVGVGFTVLGGRRISAWCYADNGASARVLAKSGLRLERRYRDTEPKSGQPVDCLEYALCVDEWTA